MKLLPIILTALLIVIYEPYKDLKYNEQGYIEDCIGYTESEGWKDSPDDTDEDELDVTEEEISNRVISIARQINEIAQSQL